MATFVHIADQRDAAAIRRNGLTLPRTPHPDSLRLRGIFALPVVPNFLVSHQWVRELKRREFRSAVGVYFRVPDDTEVWAGLFNTDKERLTAAQAAAHLHDTGTLGYEVILPRSIQPREITAVRPVPAVGWRYFPAAKGRAPCFCPYCQRGQRGARRAREQYDTWTRRS